MQPTKTWSLLVVAVIGAAFGWVIVSATLTYLPPLPWTIGSAMILLAFAELLLGRNLRVRLSGKPQAKPIQPMAVPRIVALAKASSVTAAAFGGIAGGIGGYLLGSLGKPVPAHDALVAGFTLATAAALVAAALYLERSCRTPEPPDDDDLPSHNGQHGGGFHGGRRLGGHGGRLDAPHIRRSWPSRASLCSSVPTGTRKDWI